MAAVIATTSLRSRPISTNSFAKMLVHEAALFLTGIPVSASTIPTAWNFSASSSIAGAYPRPFSVIVCTKIGPPNSFALRRAFSMASMSWPSNGPRYFNPKSSNIPCGATMSLIPFFIPCRVS